MALSRTDSRVLFQQTCTLDHQKSERKTKSMAYTRSEKTDEY